MAHDTINRDVIRSVQRACARATARTDRSFRRGLTSLATVTSVAPFFGVAGTVYGIAFDTFRGCGCSQSSALAAVADGLADSCLPLALGIGIGVASLWAYRYFEVARATFRGEMDAAALELANRLARLSANDT